MSYTRDQLHACEGATIPDLIGENCKLLFVGINPGLQTAMTGIHFAHPSNRFWPALKKAGLIDWVPDVSPLAPSVRVDINNQPGTAATQTHFCHPSNGFYPALRKSGLIGWEVDTSSGITDEQRADFVDRGMGITNLVARATTRASELSSSELRTGTTRLVQVVTMCAPKVVAISGITAYRTAFRERDALLGVQSEGIESSELWVIPNPSGLNAHETIDSLADWFGKAAVAAGVKTQRRT